MHPRSLRMAAVAAVALVPLALLLAPQARSQINTTPTLQPIGVSASGNASTAWFHEPSSRLAVACQTIVSAQGAPTGIQCVTTRLP